MLRSRFSRPILAVVVLASLIGFMEIFLPAPLRSGVMVCTRMDDTRYLNGRCVSSLGSGCYQCVLREGGGEEQTCYEAPNPDDGSNCPSLDHRDIPSDPWSW